MGKIRGLGGVKQALRQLDKETQGKVKRAVEIVAVNMSGDATERTPVDLGKLRQGNFFEISKDGFSAKIGNNVPYAPFIEFGTGGTVSVPPELHELASKFKGSGVKKINITPQPFLYPAFVKGRTDFIKRIEKIVSEKSSK